MKYYDESIFSLAIRYLSLNAFLTSAFACSCSFVWSFDESLSRAHNNFSFSPGHSEVSLSVSSEVSLSQSVLPIGKGRIRTEVINKTHGRAETGPEEDTEETQIVCYLLHI